MLVAYLAKGIGAYFSAYLMTDIGQRVVRDLRDQLFRHILNQSAAFFSRWSTGPLMSRITNDVNLVQQAVSETVGDLLREGLSLFGYAALLFWWDWRLALVCVTGAPIVVYPLVRLGQRVRRSTRRSQESSSVSRTSPPKPSPATASSRPSAPRSTRASASSAPPSSSTAPT